MRSIRIATFAFTLGSLVIGVAPVLAGESGSSAAGFSSGATRVTAGFRGRGGDTGFGGVGGVNQGSTEDRAVFDTRRGRGRDRDGRDFRHRRRGGRGFDPQLGYSEWNYRHNRTALSNGYFGHGSSSGRGDYDYDRGYPYDYYDYDGGPGGYEEAGFMPEPPRRRVRCRIEMAVRVCGG